MTPCEFCRVNPACRRGRYCSNSCSTKARWDARRQGTAPIGPNFTPTTRACRCGRRVSDCQAKRCAACKDLLKGIWGKGDIRGACFWDELKGDAGRKRYLLRVKPHKCEICTLDTWQGRPIPLELDHIDGDSGNNNLTNVRLICPNCHAQTPTYKNKNRGHGRKKRRERYHGGSPPDATQVHTYH